MTTKQSLAELKEEIKKLRDEVKELRSAGGWIRIQYIPQPYPVYVPPQPYPWPWWQNGTITVGGNYPNTTGTLTITNCGTATNAMPLKCFPSGLDNSGPEIDLGSAL